MKFKSLFFALALFTGFQGSAQVLFSEDFDGIPGSTAGGAGTYAFPAGWLLRNVDNGTPNASVAYINEAWERREDFSFNVSDSAAFSSSWTAPAGTANDWMWTPLIGPVTANTVLEWNAVTYDALYKDGYEVRIMTGISGPPTGGAGVIGNQITNSSIVFSTAAEASAWTPHSVSLAAYAGQQIYIGFRNNSTDKFVLLIDDVVVRIVYNYDVSVTRATYMSEYTLTPAQQADTIPLTAQLTNNGVLIVTNVQVQANIYDATHTLLVSQTSAPLGSLAPATTDTVDCGFFVPPTVGSYTFEFFPILSETDQQPNNDTINRYLEITDTVYARDDGAVVGALGIGAGNGGFLGQTFTINAPTSLRSVSFYVTRGYATTKAAIAVWNMTAGVPDSIIASTDTLYYPDDSARFYTLNMSGGNFDLLPGDYTFTAIEFDSTLAVGNCANIFTTGTVWVNWPTNPNSGWSNVEAFGASFTKSFVIRPNLYTCPVITAEMTSTDPSCLTCPDGTATATATGGIEPYTYQWSNGDSVQTTTLLLPGTYYVTVADAFRCIVEDTIIVGATVGIEENTSAMMVLPNPNNGTFSVIIDDFTGQNGIIEIFNILGEKVFETPVSNTGRVNQKIDLSNMPSGSYNLRMTSNQTSFSKRLIIQ